MTEKNVGIVNVTGDSRAIVDGIKELENAGIPAVWLTTGAPGPGRPYHLLRSRRHHRHHKKWAPP